jgi:hypothetical protein
LNAPSYRILLPIGKSNPHRVPRKSAFLTFVLPLLHNCSPHPTRLLSGQDITSCPRCRTDGRYFAHRLQCPAHKLRAYVVDALIAQHQQTRPCPSCPVSLPGAWLLIQKIWEIMAKPNCMEHDTTRAIALCTNVQTIKMNAASASDVPSTLAPRTW